MSDNQPPGGGTSPTFLESLGHVFGVKSGLTLEQIAKLYDVPPWMLDDVGWPLYRRVIWRIRRTIRERSIRWT